MFPSFQWFFQVNSHVSKLYFQVNFEPWFLLIKNFRRKMLKRQKDKTKNLMMMRNHWFKSKKFWKFLIFIFHLHKLFESYFENFLNQKENLFASVCWWLCSHLNKIKPQFSRSVTSFDDFESGYRGSDIYRSAQLKTVSALKTYLADSNTQQLFEINTQIKLFAG